MRRIGARTLAEVAAVSQGPGGQVARWPGQSTWRRAGSAIRGRWDPKSEIRGSTACNSASCWRACADSPPAGLRIKMQAIKPADYYWLFSESGWHYSAAHALENRLSAIVHVKGLQKSFAIGSCGFWGELQPCCYFHIA